MGVEALIGRPGSGKSYELVRRGLAEADRDRLVFANFALQHPNAYMFTPDQLMDLPPGLVLIDEAHLWFPARMALKLPMSWLTGISQTRKKGWDVLLAAQHETRIDRALRDVCSWMWLCRAWGSHEGHPILFTSTCWEPEFFRQPKRQQGRTMHFFSRKVAESYNTHETLMQAAHTEQKNDPYAAQKAAVQVEQPKTPTTGKGGPRRNGSVLEGLL